MLSQVQVTLVCPAAVVQHLWKKKMLEHACLLQVIIQDTTAEFRLWSACTLHLTNCYKNLGFVFMILVLHSETVGVPNHTKYQFLHNVALKTETSKDCLYVLFYCKSCGHTWDLFAMVS